jgi:hypothetical protein
MANVGIQASQELEREIAICNNRQNPIEAWQLFSNDPIHVEIEAVLKEKGVFYERQEGRFEAARKRLGKLRLQYQNAHDTRIGVEDLAQQIA